jgi:hypothetical protein
VQAQRLLAAAARSAPAAQAPVSGSPA